MTLAFRNWSESAVSSHGHCPLSHFVLYVSFIILIAFDPQWLGTPLGEGLTITRGIPVGVGLIVSAFVPTGIYTIRANGEFDRLTARNHQRGETMKTRLSALLLSLLFPLLSHANAIKGPVERQPVNYQAIIMFPVLSA